MRRLQRLFPVLFVVALALIVLFGGDALAQASGGGGGGGWVDVPPDATQSWWDNALMFGLLVVAMLVGMMALLVFV